MAERAYENEQVQPISAIVPGVMAQTGMESQEIIAGIIHEVQPDYLIVVDALAARSVRRLGRTIQTQIREFIPAPVLAIIAIALQKKQREFR